MPEKLLIADDHPLIREALASTFASLMPDYDVSTAANGEAVLSSLASNPATALLLLDLYMPGPNGFDLLGTIQERFPQVKVLVLTASEDPEDRRKTKQLGAAAYVLKSEPSAELARIVRRVLNGETAFPEGQQGFETEVGDKHHQERKGPASGPSLTARQQEIIKLIADGFSNNEIGRILGISVNTVKIHVSAIFRALGVSNRTQAAVLARNLGMSSTKAQKTIPS